MRASRFTVILASLAALTLALGATVARAGGAGLIVADDPPNHYEFPGGAGHDAGFTAVFNNDGSNTHTVTADDEGPDAGPLFRTGNVSGGDSKAVSGSQFLGDGEYDFHCSIHSEMQATLLVAGAPLPRPEIDVTVKSKKLAKVVNSGKLKVEVSAEEPTAADGVSLSAKKGRKSITKKANLDLAAGGSKTAKLNLKKSAVEKLAELEKAKVRVTGEVDFGSPAKATRKLK